MLRLYALRVLRWLCIFLVLGSSATCILKESDAKQKPEHSTALPDDTPLASDAEGGAKLGAVGVAVTPKNFPKHSQDDVLAMFEVARELGSISVFIYQWNNPDLVSTAGHMVALSKKSGLTPMIGLSPTSLGGGRKDFDVPARFKGKTFANKDVSRAFIQTAEELAALKPAYLCLATEINFLALQRMPEFLHFAATYKEAYKAVKRVSPSTKVFVSFQYEWVRIVDNKAPGNVDEHKKLIDIFRPELDVVGITSYPADFYATPDQIPANYYTHMQKYLQPGDEVVLMELGWPSGEPGTPAEQQRFIEVLPILMKDLKPSVIAWSLLHDVDIPEFGSNLASTGLCNVVGDRKGGFASFKALED